MHTREEKTWNVVKYIKTQWPDYRIEDKVRKVQEKLKILNKYSDSVTVSKNVLKKHLKTAAEMFIYLSVEVSTLNKIWLKFYGNLFETQPATQIILTLNRMMRKSPLYNFIVHEKLFRKATTLFKLKNQEIQSFMPGKSKNISSIYSKSSILRGMNK